jgi:signal transduction histidine kinase
VNGLLRRLLLTLVLVFGVGAALLQLTQREAPGGVVEISQAGFIKSDAPVPPPASADWLPRPLPDNWNRTNPGQSGFGWYRATFNLPEAPVQAWAALLPSVATTHQLFINGVDVGGGDMTGPIVRSFGRPQLNQIAPQILRQGGNELVLRLRVAPNLRGGLGPITLGPRAVIEPIYERDYVIRVTLPRALNVALLFAGVLVLLLWLQRPSESIYGVFAALAIVWSVRNFHYTVTVPIDSAVWEAFVLGSLGVVVVLHWMFMRRYTGVRASALEHRLLAAAVVSLPFFAGLDPLLVSRLRLPWYVLCAGIGVWSIVLLVRHIRSAGASGDAGPWVILAGAVITLLLGMTDLAVSAQLLPFGPAARMSYGAPLLLSALVYALAEGYFRTYEEARALNADLERRVQERAGELERTHERLRALERVATVASERERLMRDMHDGIGSQLITTLQAVERGGTGPEEVAEQLRACMDDLRLMIDSLEPDDRSLQIALANLCYRLEPRLRSGGITLHWEVQDGVALPTAGNTLQVLRIVQEAVTNVLKHASAAVLRLTCRTDASGLLLEIVDDGRGINSTEPAPSGAQRGMQNMRVRALQLGGTLEVAATGHGTRLLLRVPTIQPALEQGRP